MASKLVALGRPVHQPAVYRCACGCGAYACRGFPNDVWCAAGCVPPAMRFPWEAGYVARASADELPAPIAAAPTQAALPLAAGFLSA